MKWSSVLLFGILIAGMVVFAGCTREGSSPSVAATPASPSPALSTSALAAADAPANFTLAESRVKTPDEVANRAKDLGWEDGYLVKFSGTADGQTAITQNLVTYPAASIPVIMRTIESEAMGETGRVFTPLPSPGLGESSYAFSGKADTRSASPQNGNPLQIVTPGTGQKPDMVEIIFTKGSTIEILRMEGPGTDYAILRNLSGTAWARLP